MNKIYCIWLLLIVCSLFPVEIGSQVIHLNKIGAETVWNPDGQFLMKIREEVEKDLPGAMKKYGASPQAVAFAKNNKGCYLSEFKEMGRIDLAYMSYAFPGSTYYGSFLLVNGTPYLVEVGADEVKNINFAANDHLRKLHPKIDWYAQNPEFFKMEALSPGGQRFIFFYPLSECKPCETVVKALVAYDFDPNGRFLGSKLVGYK